MLILVIIISLIIYIEQFKEFKKPVGYSRDYKCNIVDLNKKKYNIYTLKTIQPSKTTKGLPILEIEHSKFQNLLNTIIDDNLPNKNLFTQLENSKYNYYTGMKELNINNKQISNIVNFIINRINNLLLNNGLTDGLNNGFFTILSYNLVNIFKNKSNNDMKYTINIVIYRINKRIAYQLQTTILVLNKIFKIEQLDIIGNFTTDKLSSIEPKTNYNHIDIFSKFNSDTIFNYKNYFRYSNYDNIFYSRKNNTIIEEQKKEFEDIRKYKCFVNNNLNLSRNICQNDRNIDGNKFTKRGIWDKICEKDTECPFYKSNKNYPNNFGGCIDNKCQLPINMKSLSPHFYDYKEHNKPYCYNCKEGNYMCCDEQMDKTKYPLVKSPDYAFPNDYKLRYKYRDILKKNGLTYSKVYN